MSIVAYTGLPGAGKSYGVMENVILPALKQGRTIWTNVPLNLEAISEQFPAGNVEIFDHKEISERPAWLLDTVPPGCVFVLDEVAKVWKQGARASNVPEEWITFLTEHRHRVGEDGFSQEVVLVMQDLGQTANFVRELVEKTFIAKKMDAVGAKNRFKVDVYDGAIKGQKGPESQKINKLYGKYKPEVYALYKSHTQSQTDGAGLEQKADSRGSVWRNPFIRYTVPFFLLVVCFAVYYIRGLLTGEDSALIPESQRNRPTAQQPQGIPVNRPKAEKVQPTGPRDSKTWRLAGVIIGADGYERAFIVSAKASRTIGTQNCKHFQDTGEMYCYVDGDRVASWTAPDTMNKNDPASGMFGSAPGELASR